MDRPALVRPRILVQKFAASFPSSSRRRSVWKNWCITAARPSRRALQALLRMRYVFDGIKKIPHPEEAVERPSRRTHRACPAQFQFFHRLGGRDRPRTWIPAGACPRAGQRPDPWAGMTRGKCVGLGANNIPLGRLAAFVLLAGFCRATAAAEAADDAHSTKGEYLARAGDCIACHTNPGGALFAGGRPMATPFGTIYTSNITPDRTALRLVTYLLRLPLTSSSATAGGFQR